MKWIIPIDMIGLNVLFKPKLYSSTKNCSPEPIDERSDKWLKRRLYIAAVLKNLGDKSGEFENVGAQLDLCFYTSNYT